MLAFVNYYGSPAYTTDTTLTAFAIAENYSRERERLKNLALRVSPRVVACSSIEECLQESGDLLPEAWIIGSELWPQLCKCSLQRIKSAKTRFVSLTFMVRSDDDVKNALDNRCNEYFVSPADDEQIAVHLDSLYEMQKNLKVIGNGVNPLPFLGAAIRAKGTGLLNHSERVSDYAVRFGEALELGTSEIECLRTSGILHDIGKLAIPNAVLNKPGRLTSHEYEVIKRHPMLGIEICEGFAGANDVIPQIRHHHERLDGTGYPDALTADHIPFLAKIITISDIYDALTTKYVWRNAYSPEAAFGIMYDEARKGWWDDTLIKILEKAVKERINKNGKQPG